MASTTTTEVVPKPTVVRCNIEQQCPIQYVTVYNDRAEVTRLLRHHFDLEGTYDVVFEGFSPFVDLSSLHVSGGTGKACTILEVSYQTRHEDSTEQQTDFTKIEQLQNELNVIQEEIEKHQRELDRVSKQRAWLEGRANKLMNQDVQKDGDDLQSMEQFLDFYHRTLSKLDNEKTAEEKEIKALNEKKSSLEEKFQQHGAKDRASRQKQKPEVTITVHIAEKNIDVGLEIAYLISNCSWTASYDVRVSSADVTQPKTQLTYYGIIVNQSQENWSDVQLSLSTATPSLGGALPKLATLRINFMIEQLVYAKAARKSAFSLKSSSTSASFARPAMGFASARHSLSPDSYIDEEDEREGKINVLATETEAGMSSSNFAIPRRSTIEADGKPHKVTIAVLDLTSTFTYTVVPKLSLYAYLKASTVNTSDKQLLAGPASVFMNNNFITHSAIANVCVGDQFDLPLGVDASVKVEYKPAKKLADTHGLISKVHHETVRHEVHLTNTKASEVIVHVYDQLPLSSNETIKVKLLQPDLRAKELSPNCTVTLNDANNLEWKCVLAARGECRLPLEYTMEWPKDRRVELKQA